MEWHEHTDESLIGYAASHLEHQGPAAMEMQRRLLVAIGNFNATSTRQSASMIRLTWAIAALTLVLAVVAALQLAAMPKAGTVPDTKETKEVMLRLKGQCRDAGAKTRAEWLKTFPNEHFSDEPQYAYNGDLNTCLYADSYTDSGHPLIPGVKFRQIRFILDSYANKTLIEYTAYDGKPIEGSVSEAEFDSKKGALMGQ